MNGVAPFGMDSSHRARGRPPAGQGTAWALGCVKRVPALTLQLRDRATHHLVTVFLVA